MSTLIARIRTRLGEIRPAQQRATVDRRRIYSYALIGVALLVGLAWINNFAGGDQRDNSGSVAAAFLVALVLGLLWVAFAAHRAVLTLGLAIVWWIGASPALGVIATAGLPSAEVYLAMSQATATNVGLGVVVWLTAVLMRSPRPATTVMACWVLNFVVVALASFVVARQAWVAGFVVTVAVLIQRAGLLARLRSGRHGQVDPDDETQVAVRDALTTLPPGYAVRYGLAVGGDAGDMAGEHDGGGITVVVGPTGTYAVSGLLADGPVRPISGGTRLAMGARRLDADVRLAAVVAGELAALLRTPVQPVLVVAGGPFADGLARVAVRPGHGRQAVEVLVLRDDLAAGRLSHGHAVLTTGQVSRITRRLVRAASTAEPGRVEVLAP